MANLRKIVFSNENYYHIFNRGTDGRLTFSNKREYLRAKKLLYFYQFASIPIRYSRFKDLTAEKQNQYMDTMIKSGKIVDIIAYCLMPNHFHLLLKQKDENGISTFTANFINAYTKYFNAKHVRIGHLFQGVFKGMHVETDEQLVHLTRYIHLNPAASSLIAPQDLPSYAWSSYPAYISDTHDIIIGNNQLEILSFVSNYVEFTKNQISYAKELAKIKHLLLD